LLSEFDDFFLSYPSGTPPEIDPPLDFIHGGLRQISRIEALGEQRHSGDACQK
jgi:hypothetical protein